jgi:hypothetical protein
MAACWSTRTRSTWHEGACAGRAGGVRSRGRATLVAIGGLTMALAACLLWRCSRSRWPRPIPHVRDPDRTSCWTSRATRPASPAPGSARAGGVRAAAEGAPRAAGPDQPHGLGRHGVPWTAASNPALPAGRDPDLVDVLNLRSARRRPARDAGRPEHRRDHQRPAAQAVGRPAARAGDRPPRLESHGQWYDVGAVVPDTDRAARSGTRRRWSGTRW